MSEADPAESFRRSVHETISAAYPGAKLVSTSTGVMGTIPATQHRRAAGIACHMKPGEAEPARAGVEAANLVIKAYRGEE